MKKILFVHTKSEPGGAQRYIYDIARNLPKDSFDVMIAAGGSGSLKTLAQKAGIPYIEIKNSKRDVSALGDIKTFFELIRLFKKIKPDIVHLNGSKAGTMGAIAARCAKVPKVIFSTHGWPFLEPRSPIQIFLIKMILKFAARCQDKIICISQFDKDTAKQNHIAPGEKLERILVGIDPAEHIFLSREEARKELFKKAGLTYNPGAVVVCTIAEYTRNKGLPYLIESAHEITKLNPSAFFFLIGWGEDKQLLEKLINQKKGSSGRIFLIENLPEAYAYLRGTDVFVLPSLKEGLPYTLLEAGLAELPLIGTRVGGIPEVIEHEKNGLLVGPASPHELVSAVSDLMRDRNKRQRFGNASRKIVMERFLLKSRISNICELYNKL